jgi:cytochrome b subunit of formate dehydrogenase
MSWFVQTGVNPWNEEVFMHAQWGLVYAALAFGVLFMLGHTLFVMFWPKPKGIQTQPVSDALAAKVPAKVVRHSLAARLFHWIMAASMLTLLVTSFAPILGWRFDWVQIHYLAGIALTISIIYHIIHATFWLDFWSIWVGPKDIPEFKSEIMLELGQDVPGYRPGKYPLGNKLYHLAIVVVGFAAVITGLLMMPRIRTPLFTRDPYYMTDSTWGFTYVLHGLAGVGLVGLVIAHVYFAVRPDKWWITKGMIFGWIPRRLYLEHHDPQRWKVSDKAQPASRA